MIRSISPVGSRGTRDFSRRPTGDALAVVLFAGLLGWLGAHLSVNRHLRDIEPR